MRSRVLAFGGVILVLAAAAGVRLTAQRASGGTATFNKDVAPIIFNNCVGCHRPDQIAPMSLMSYKEVRPWARAIKDKVVNGQMPPWYADPRFGEFRNDKRLSAEQIAAIVAWADGGAPEGDTPLTAQLPAVNVNWNHPSGRPPDLVVTMAEPFNVPAQGEIPNFSLFQELPPELKNEDHWLEAIQVMPQVVAGVHHASFGVAPLPPGIKIGVGEVWPGGPAVLGGLIDAKTGKSAARDVNRSGVGEGEEAAAAEGARGKPGALRYCCYVPGGSFRQYRAGAGYRIPRDGAIVWGLHYTPIGRPFTDQTRVGLWFQKDMQYEIVGAGGPGKTHLILGSELVDDDKNPLRKKGIANAGWPAVPVIPPNAKNWSITAIQVFKEDMTLYAMWPHMHTRGKEMTYVLTYPDGKERVLLSVPNYDFNWQLFYELKEPVKVPAGSTLKLVGSYDNSPANKWNASPNKEVYWSEQSWDEMYIGFTDLSFDKKAAEKPAPAAGQRQSGN